MLALPLTSIDHDAVLASVEVEIRRSFLTTVGRRIDAEHHELFVVCDPAEALQLQFERQIHILPIFNLTWTENRGISLGLLTAEGELGRWLLVAMTAAMVGAGKPATDKPAADEQIGGTVTSGGTESILLAMKSDTYGILSGSVVWEVLKSCKLRGR